MKRIVAVFTIVVMMLCLAACGETEKKEEVSQEEKGCEVAMIVNGAKVKDGSFNQATWESIKSFTTEYELVSKYYKSEEGTKEGYLASIQKAVDDGAKIIVMPGSNFETAVYEAQTAYPDVYFLLIDGVPHDDKNSYVTEANTVGIIFAEEEAGYLAGYAAVKDGYKKLGFLGGRELPPVKRYGYGFVQGAAAAAAEMEVKVELKYQYAGTFEASDDAQELAASWYKDGTKVIFACGGDMGKSVMKAAEKNKGKVIGVDVDQSHLSETVVTSAEKDIATAVEDILKTYVDQNFIGGTAFNYAAKNDGVKLEMENAVFRQFTEDDYKKIFRKLKNDKIELKKDTGVGAVTELAGEWVTVEQ